MIKEAITYTDVMGYAKDYPLTISQNPSKYSLLGMRLASELSLKNELAIYFFNFLTTSLVFRHDEQEGKLFDCN